AYALQPRHMSRRYRLNTLRARRAPRIGDVTAAMRFGRARLSALRRGTRQAVTSGSASGRAYRDLQRLAPPQSLLLASSSRPVVVPERRGPKPPGDGVCGSARRDRTRSALKSTLAKGIPRERAARLKRHRRTIVNIFPRRAAQPLIPRHFLFSARARVRGPSSRTRS